MSMLESKIQKVMPITQDHDKVLDLIFTPEEEKVSTAIDLVIPVTKGKGSNDYGWFPTFGATGSGYGEITAPGEGTWDVFVYDKVNKQYIIKKYGMKKGEKVYVTYETNFWGVHPVVTVRWSEPKDTTFKMKLNGSI